MAEMEKSELRVDMHKLTLGETVIEVWHEGEMVATVYGADGAGVRIITKHSYDIVRGGMGELVKVVEVKIEPS